MTKNKSEMMQFALKRKTIRIIVIILVALAAIPIAYYSFSALRNLFNYTPYAHIIDETRVNSTEEVGKVLAMLNENGFKAKAGDGAPWKLTINDKRVVSVFVKRTQALRLAKAKLSIDDTIWKVDLSDNYPIFSYF